MRFQFRLRTLFIVVTVAAVACAWLGHEYRIVQERKAMRQRIEHVSGMLTKEDYDNRSSADEPSLIRQLMGDRTVKVIYFPQTEVPIEDVRRIKNCFPGAAIVLDHKHYVGGPGKIPYLVPGFTARD